MAKFLSETGLSTVWSKIDTYFLRKTDFNSSAYADTVPTQNSSKLITSGGMYNVLEELEDVVAASENSLNNRLSTIEGMNLVIGTGLTADKLVLGNGNSTVKTSSKGITTVAPSSSSDDTTIPTSAAVNSAISSALGTVTGALKYKGAVASNSALPATHSVGDVYVVSTAGTFAGKACEVGDYIICKASGTAANNADWDVLNGENQVSNAGASLAAAGSSATIATVDGTNITVTTPSTWTGVDKTGTITKVGTVTSGEASVTSADATIGTDLTTIGTVGGVNIKAKIGSYSSSSHTHDLSIATDSGTNALTMAANTKYKLTAGGKTFIFTTPPDGHTDTKVTQTPTTSSNSSWRPLILGSSYSDATTFTISAATDVTYSTHLAKFKPSTGVMAVVGLNKMTTSGTVTAGSDTTVWNTNGGTVSLGGYVKLDAGAAEQTIKSSIGTFSKGVINLWRNSGDHYTFLGFSNGTTETALGGIGFKSQADHNLYRKDGSNYYKILDESNYTSYVNTTNFPGINSTGTITKVGNTTSGAVTVSSANNTAAFGSAVTVGSVGGVDLKFTMPANPNSNTTYTFASGTTNGAFSVTPSGGTAQSVSIYGLKSAAYTESGDYVKLSPGTVEQTISSGISTAVNGVINLYRSNGNYVSYIGFSNKQNNAQTLLGLIGFTNAGVFSYRKPDGTTYTVLHSGNYNDSAYADTVPTENSTKLITSGGMYAVLDEIESTLAASEDALNTRVTTLENNTITGSGLTADKIVLGNGTRTVKTSSKGITTTAPSSSSDDTTIPTSKAVNSAIASHAGVDKTGTVTSVTLTQGTGITVSSSGTAITGSGSRTITLNKATTSAIGGMRASNALTTSVTLTSGNGATADRYYGVQVDKDGKAFVNVPWSAAGAGTVTSITPGTGLRNGTGTTAITVSGTLNLISATTSELGGIKAAAVRTDTNLSLTTGGTTANRYYGVELDGNGNAFVNVPWETIKQDGITGATITRFGTCSTAANTAAKTVSVGAGTVTLEAGLRVTVKFSSANTADNPTLNVNSKGAKNIFHKGTRITTGTNKALLAGTVDFVYDGTQWHLIGNYLDTDTHNSHALTVTNGTASAASGDTITYVESVTGCSATNGNLTATTTRKTATVPTDSTVQGWGYTKGIKLRTPGGGALNTGTGGVTPASFASGRNLKDSSGTEIVYSPSSGTNIINAIPAFRQDASWGDWIFYWENHNAGAKTGIAFKGNTDVTEANGPIGDLMFAGHAHFMNQLTFAASGSYTPGTMNTGKMAAAFYGMAPSNVGTKSCGFYIQCKAYDPTNTWMNFVNFRFDESGIYKYYPADCPSSTYVNKAYWILDESMALSDSEIDSILANAT